MRLVTFENSGSSRVGMVRTGTGGALELVDLAATQDSPRSVKQLLGQRDESLAQLKEAATRAPGRPLDEFQLLAPITNPQKVICVGLNYADHAAETGAKAGEEPVIFCKFPSAVRGHLAPIKLPPESDQVDYEAELVVVIGRRARRVSRSNAWKHIAGYSCGNDVSARDWQKNKPGRQWLLGKSFDSFAPWGPWIVTRDEIADPHALPIKLELNGQVMQQSNTRELIFRVDYLISYLSHVATLMPGDLIFTGTPSGVGMARNPPVFLKPGDELAVTIESIGTLRNHCVAAKSST